MRTSYLMSCDHLKALDLAKQGKLEQSHKLVQPYSDELSCLIHAYIHRAQGDFSNANYWYRRVGLEQPDCSLEEEVDGLYKKVQSG